LGKALIVDDSRAIRQILARILRELHYEIAEAGDGHEALALLEADPGAFRLALVDWNMPVMNGLELLKTLRAQPAFERLPVVMVSTETEMGHMAEAIEAGANEYVMKPFTKDILLGKLEYVGAVGGAEASLQP
jgi:two-component system, chemotaxis family, chemotaxis protein CheY